MRLLALVLASSFLPALAYADEVKQFLDQIGESVDQPSKGNVVDKSEANSATLSGAWIVRIETSPMDDSENVTIATTARDSVADKFARTYHPRLVAECRERSTQVYIHFDGMFVADSGGFGLVEYRIDKRAPKRREFQESSDNQALGLWHGAGIGLLKAMKGAGRILFRATPYNESPVIFEFSLNGFDSALARLRKPCRW